MIAENYLVPGRECGTCSACCKEISIAGGGIDKPAGVPCRHLAAGKGCSIYSARPNLCRVFNCLWRSFDNVDEEWRPDRSGILMRLSNLPAHGASVAVELILFGPPEVLVSERFASLVGGFVESGTTVHLLVSVGPGLFMPSAMLNDQLRPYIAARDLAAVQQLMASCYRQLMALPRTRIPKGEIGYMEDLAAVQG